MEVFIPILGLEKLGLDPIQLLKIRNTDAPGHSTLPPATNVNHSLVNLLLLVDNIFATRKGAYIKNRIGLHAVFKFPILNNPEIFQGQHQLDSMGLGLLIKAADAFKLHSFKNKFDYACATGIIKKYPSDSEILSGDFLNDTTGEIDRKFSHFLEFVESKNLRDKRGAFIYCGEKPETAYSAQLEQKGFVNMTVKRMNNFNDILDFLFARQNSKKKYVAGAFAAVILACTVFLVSQTWPKDPCESLLEAAKTNNVPGIQQTVHECQNIETTDKNNKTAFYYAIQNNAKEAARILLEYGAQIKVANFSDSITSLETLRSVCSSDRGPCPKSGILSDDSVHWGIYWENNLPIFSMKKSVSPAAKEASHSVMQFSLWGGDSYAFVHFYRNFAPVFPASSLSFECDFQIPQKTTFNNQKNDSIIQAIEFSSNIYRSGKRYELALQWRNVGEGAPGWFYWDAQEGWISLRIEFKPEFKKWYHLHLEGAADTNRVLYHKFSIGNTSYNIPRQAMPETAAGIPDMGAVAIQLDGNYRADPYDILVKNIKAGGI